MYVVIYELLIKELEKLLKKPTYIYFNYLEYHNFFKILFFLMKLIKKNVFD